jgi:hypothetical protein
MEFRIYGHLPIECEGKWLTDKRANAGEDMTLMDRTWEDRSITFNVADYNEGAEWVKTKTPSKQRRPR